MSCDNTITHILLDDKYPKKWSTNAMQVTNLFEDNMWLYVWGCSFICHIFMQRTMKYHPCTCKWSAGDIWHDFEDSTDAVMIDLQMFYDQ